ncbi:MAG: MBL fold metallo-hydrolase [Deltaproteobacteria bacterium]|nr:MBL fold metallo-hydrolase [Deltaproteobacteria bacterium]
MKIRVIGWWGAYPGPGEATSCYLLQSGGLNILLDCGSGVLGALQAYIDLEKIDAVVLSHYHADHVADLGCLQYATRVLMDLGKREKPLAVYGHAEDHHFTGLDYHDFSKGYAIDVDTHLVLGDTAFTFWRNVHPDPCFSMRIEKNKRVLTYISDTQWDDGLVDAARDADLLICESSLYNEYKGVVGGHLAAGEAGLIAEKAGAAHLVLSHLPHFGNHQDLARQAAEVFRGPVELAATGKNWEL